MFYFGFSCKSHLAPGPRQKKAATRVGPARRHWFLSPLRLSAYPSLRSVFARSGHFWPEIHLNFRGPRYLPRREEEIITTRTIFVAALLIFRRSSPSLGIVIRSGPPTGMAQSLFLCAFFWGDGKMPRRDASLRTSGRGVSRDGGVADAPATRSGRRADGAVVRGRRDR